MSSSSRVCGVVVGPVKTLEQLPCQGAVHKSTDLFSCMVTAAGRALVLRLSKHGA